MGYHKDCGQDYVYGSGPGQTAHFSRFRTVNRGPVYLVKCLLSVKYSIILYKCVFMFRFLGSRNSYDIKITITSCKYTQVSDKGFKGELT